MIRYTDTLFSLIINFKIYSLHINDERLQKQLIWCSPLFCKFIIKKYDMNNTINV